jgi:hypothetical protein
MQQSEVAMPVLRIGLFPRPRWSPDYEQCNSIDILPALKREDSFVGRRAFRRYPEGNFLTPRGEYRGRALHVGPRNEGMAYSASEVDAVSACAVPNTA